jgi:hypothetical protein
MAKRKINKKLVAKNNSTRAERKEAERRANARQDKNDAAVRAKNAKTRTNQIKSQARKSITQKELDRFK